SETRAFPARPLRKISFLIWWTWHDLNVRPRPSQSRALIPLSYRSERLAEAAGVEPAHAKRGDLANRCLTVWRRLQLMNGGRDRSRTCKRQMRGSFRDYCLTS